MRRSWVYISSCRVASTAFLTLSLSLSLSLTHAIYLYHPSLSTGPLDYILYPYISVVDNFLLAVQHSHVRVMGSIGVSCFCDLPYFSRSVVHVLSVLFRWFWRWEESGRTIFLWLARCCDTVLTVRASEMASDIALIQFFIPITFLLFYISLVGLVWFAFFV